MKIAKLFFLATTIPTVAFADYAADKRNTTSAWPRKSLHFRSLQHSLLG